MGGELYLFPIQLVFGEGKKSLEKKYKSERFLFSSSSNN